MEIFAAPAAVISAGVVWACERTGGEAEGNYWREEQASASPPQERGMSSSGQRGTGEWRLRLLRSCADQPVVSRHVSTRVQEVR